MYLIIRDKWLSLVRAYDVRRESKDIVASSFYFKFLTDRYFDD